MVGEEAGRWCYGSTQQQEWKKQFSTLASVLTRPPTLPALPALTSSSAVQGRDSELPRRTEWPLARDVDDKRRLRAPLQLLGMLKAQRL